MTNATTPHGAAEKPSPFHEGERRLQALCGVADQMDQRGRAFIRDHMPDQHRAFFGKMPFVLVAGLDDTAQPWATVWCGPPGFMQSPDPQHLVLARPQAVPGDPVQGLWHAGSPIGLLGIEPHTRRRNRMNGVVAHADEQGLTVEVRQSFGNCPKYIQPRHLVWRAHEGGLPAEALHRESSVLSEAAIALIARADMMFIASSSPDAGQAHPGDGSGLDVSHRGGAPGFIEVHRQPDATHLILPDYVGNFMFNTLGNILLQPRIGLFFFDAETGEAMWLAATATVDTDSADIGRHPGALRLLRIRVSHGWYAAQGLPLSVQSGA